MRRGGLAAALALGALLVGAPAGAGLFGGDDPPSRIPVPAHDFGAVVIDVSGVRVALTRATWNGEVFLYGRLGEGQATVPFEKLAHVDFAAGKDDDERIATATLVDGSQVKLRVKADIPVYGATVFGNYKIEASQVARIEQVTKR